jgi:recombination protein RecA
MSSVLVPVPALGPPFSLTPREEPQLVAQRIAALPKLAGVTPAARLEIRPAPEMVSSGIFEIDALTGGWPRGCLSEICGSVSSGRSSVLLAALSAATRRQEVCALVDTTDALNPLSAAAAGVDFAKLLWVRCSAQKFSSQKKKELQRKGNEGPVEQALRVTDLLLQSGGFGMVAIDLGDVAIKLARRIPLTSWFRFQRAVENTPTVLLVSSPVPCAQTAANQLLAFSYQLSVNQKCVPSHAQLIENVRIRGELLRSRLERKPVRSAARFMVSTLRTG